MQLNLANPFVCLHSKPLHWKCSLKNKWMANIYVNLSDGNVTALVLLAILVAVDTIDHFLLGNRLRSIFSFGEVVLK